MRYLSASSLTIVGTALVFAAVLVFATAILVGGGSEEAIAVSTMKSRSAYSVPNHKMAVSLAYRCSVCLPR